MSMIRFGAKCDRCGVEHNNYSIEDVYSCNDCGLDLCAICRWLTHHVVTRTGDCCEEHGGPAASCELEVTA